ncbi:MAG: MarR family transcriptional regulator [Devosia sp.]
MTKDGPGVTEFVATAERPPEAITHGRLLYLIHELSRLVATNFDQAMARHKLTHSQWWGIMHLYENQGVSQSDLANIMQMGRASAGKLLERMEAKGWIERRPDPADSRIRRVYFADGVVPVFMLMDKEGNRLFDALLAGLDADTEAMVIAALTRIRRRAEAAIKK